MEVAVLQPHDCLKRYPHQHHQRRRYPSTVNSNPNPNVNSNRSNRRRRNSPPPPPTPLSSNGPVKAQQPRPKSPPVMGQVRILKRGEDLSRSLPSSPPPPPPAPVHDPVIIRSRSGPILDGFYAGSAFITSPSPSEVPLPAFFGKKTGGEAHNQEIACELRKVLKLV